MQIRRGLQKALSLLHNRQSGMTGLETAIILIAFVTVASVLAYSVLSSGIFSAERAKETVYKGLTKASNTVGLSSFVLGFSPNATELESVQFFISLEIPNEKIDTRAIVINFWDKETHAEGIANTITLASDSLERGVSYLLEKDEQFKVTVTIPDAANVTAYESFTIEVIPPAGDVIKISRSLPGQLKAVMDLH